jgi:2,4-dienoyl-CoA reductase-like NADH-dependent reductase (Old Yellow Enzyme family)
LLIRIVEAVKAVWPPMNPLFVRISVTDWLEKGWSLEESIQLSVILKNKGVDLIDCSSGGNIASARISVFPGYQVPFAESIRKTGILTGAVGLITHAEQAEMILSENKADLILLGRELLRNPYFALEAARTMHAEITWPIQYERARLLK